MPFIQLGERIYMAPPTIQAPFIQRSAFILIRKPVNLHLPAITSSFTDLESMRPFQESMHIFFGWI